MARLSSSTILTINQLLSDGITGNVGFSIAAGRVIAALLPLPQDQVSDLEKYIFTYIRPKVRNIVGQLHELLPHRYEDSINYTAVFYKYRLNVANLSAFPGVVRKDKEIQDFFDLSVIFSDNVIDEIKQHGDKIGKYSFSIAKVLNETRFLDEQPTIGIPDTVQYEG
jgi:hypothetical protein